MVRQASRLGFHVGGCLGIVPGWNYYTAQYLATPPS